MELLPLLLHLKNRLQGLFARLNLVLMRHLYSDVLAAILSRLFAPFSHETLDKNRPRGSSYPGRSLSRLQQHGLFHGH